MKYPGKKCIRMVLISAPLAFMLEGSIHAQNPPPPPAPAPSVNNTQPAQPNINRIPPRRNQAEMDMEILLLTKAKAADAERAREKLINQLNEDFQKIDQINAEQIIPLAELVVINYKTLSQATGEIKDRALRIKYNIPLEIKDNKGEKVRYEVEADNLNKMLPELSRLIKGFLQNPVFHVAAPNDAELRSTAGRDLDGIIKLSDAINKLAKKLQKTTN